jgi:hypothetical protein
MQERVDEPGVWKFSHGTDKAAERNRDRQKCLRRFALLFPQREKYARKNAFDLLVVKKPNVLLAEVKTLRADELDQLRLALAQILWYEHFSVRPH